MNERFQLTPLVLEHDHIQGPASAPLTLVEYGDYECPYCGEIHPVIKRLQKALGNKLRFVFRNFPLTGIHPHAKIAAQTAEAAALQGKFWEMHDVILENQELLTPEVLPAWANALGLNMKHFAEAIRDGGIDKRIEEDRAGGVESGVAGTPSFFINGTLYSGETDYDSLRAALLDREVPVRDRNE